MSDISVASESPTITPMAPLKPFSMSYVLRTTARHMRKSIDISIRMTFDRLPEFMDNQEKSQEVFRTLSFLHSMRKQLDDFQAENSKEFKGTKHV